MNEGLSIDATKKSKLTFIVAGAVVLLTLISGSWFGYVQYTLNQDAKELRQSNSKLMNDVISISDFENVNDDPEVVALTKKGDESSNKFNEYDKKNLIDHNYATLLNTATLDNYNVEVAADHIIQNYEAKTSNEQIKDLFEDLKLASSRRVEAITSLKDTTSDLLRFMKSDDLYHWNESMGYYNDFDDKYSATVDKYFDVKHELEKIRKNSVSKVKNNQKKLDEINSKLWFK
ncbi:hypothetical protein [Gottfriedia luciferensis]|uniref:hypothetical protein n=1 Tax=Gottfriedia luciferensis TaxID=178774 RepID=UPI000B4369FA|nr:hypothetical protein [Gottfriedia luciferensis]